MSKLVVIGSSNTDMIVQLPRIPRPGETLLGGAFQTAPGGKGANQALAAKRLGAAVTLIARVGDDAAAATALALLRTGKLQDAINTFKTAITIVPNQPQGYAGLGLSYQRQGRLNKAITALETVVALDAGLYDVSAQLAAEFGMPGVGADQDADAHRIEQEHAGRRAGSGNRPGSYFRGWRRP